MAEVAIILMVIVGLSAVGILLLALYLGFKVLQLIGHIIGALFGAIWHGIAWFFRAIFGFGRKHVANHVHCSRPACGEANPVSAQFCRRCGRTLRPEFVPGEVVSGHRAPPPIPGAALGSR